MKLEVVEMYSEASNDAVLKLAGRNFPGSLISGDSLSILVADIAEAKAALENGCAQDAKEIISCVLERLVDRLKIYTEALKFHNLELPFSEHEAPV